MPATLSHTSAYVCPVAFGAAKSATTGTAHHMRWTPLSDVTKPWVSNTAVGNYPQALPIFGGTSSELILAGKQYLEFQSVLAHEYEALSGYYQDVPWSNIQTAIQSTLFQLLELNPQVIKASLTYEQSIYYTLRTGAKTFFLQHFLVSEEGDDEALLAIFSGDQKLPSIGGTLTEVLAVLRRIASPINTPTFATTFDAFSR